jgi:cystathionine beta-lyase/cystathionine gamma-synthase
MSRGLGPQTRAVRAAIGTDRSHRAVVPPIHLSANFVFDAPGECGRYDYTRSGNPTRDQFAETDRKFNGPNEVRGERGQREAWGEVGALAPTSRSQLNCPPNRATRPPTCGP